MIQDCILHIIKRETLLIQCLRAKSSRWYGSWQNSRDWNVFYFWTERVHTEDSLDRSATTRPSISEAANLSPKTNTLVLFKVFKHTHTHPNINGRDTSHTLFTQNQTHTHTHKHTHTSSLLLPEFWPTGLRPLAFTHSRSNKHTHTHGRTHKQDQTHTKQAASTLKEVYSEVAEEVWKHTGSRDTQDREVEESEEIRGAGVVTLAGVWRACSLRRTSRRCCRTPSPSGEPREPCSRECPCDRQTHNSFMSNTHSLLFTTPAQSLTPKLHLYGINIRGEGG